MKIIIDTAEELDVMQAAELVTFYNRHCEGRECSEIDMFSKRWQISVKCNKQSIKYRIRESWG